MSFTVFSTEVLCHMCSKQILTCGSLRELVAAQYRDLPQSTALLSKHEPLLTYAGLNGQIDRIGSVLRAHKITHNDRVAIVLPNGPEMAATFLGVACYSICAPLNPAYGPAELEFYLTDLAAKAVVTSAGTDQAVRDVAIRLGLMVLDVEAFKDSGGDDLPTDDFGREDALALVLHTSGTTSRPKQVPLSHRNLCESASAIARTLALTPDDICLNVMPLFHIHGLVGVLLSSMAAGASVICTPGFDSELFPGWITQSRPTWYSAVPTIHQSIIAVTRESSVCSGHCLRLIRSSSSALPPAVMAKLEATFGVPVIESYGMTEAAHQMASNPLPPAKRKPGSVGVPAGPEMGIMDDAGNLLPEECDGEIVIRGPSVTSGYLNNAEATSLAFTNGWFRTGDLGRRDQEGYYVINGRKKEMINRGGENISPREIDEVLLEHEAVGQAVAFAVPHPTLGEDVAAAVVLRHGSTSDEGDLRRFAFQRLASFKVPSRIVFVDAIPKGPTGKIQRIGLHEKLRTELQQEFVAPRSDMEEILVQLWGEVLTADNIGVHHNFFGLGGDSLAASGLVARINSRFDLSISVSVVFKAPSVEAQAVLVESVLLDQIEDGSK